MVTVSVIRIVNNHTIFLYTFFFLLFLFLTIVYINQCLKLTTKLSKTTIENITNKIVEVKVPESKNFMIRSQPQNESTVKNYDISLENEKTYEMDPKINETTSNLMYMLCLFFVLTYFMTATRRKLTRPKEKIDTTVEIRNA